MGLEGTWYNELGSILNVASVSDGYVTGSYETGTTGGCASGQYVVVGRTDVNGGEASGTVGWAVTWLNDATQCQSTTTWSGQYQTINGEETITALWLLTTKTAPESDWASTLVGEDVFTRTQPGDVEIASRLTTKRPSHP